MHHPKNQAAQPKIDIAKDHAGHSHSDAFLIIFPPLELHAGTMSAKDPECRNQDDTKENKNHPGIVSRHNWRKECKRNTDRAEETDLCQLIGGGTTPRIRPQLKREITWFFHFHGSLVVALPTHIKQARGLEATCSPRHGSRTRTGKKMGIYRSSIYT